eukprot:352766-Chlamydomonas_euryale.AAC.9
MGRPSNDDVFAIGGRTCCLFHLRIGGRSQPAGRLAWTPAAMSGEGVPCSILACISRLWALKPA